MSLKKYLISLDGSKGQAALEFFILLAVLTYFTILATSTFFGRTKVSVERITNKAADVMLAEVD